MKIKSSLILLGIFSLSLTTLHSQVIKDFNVTKNDEPEFYQVIKLNSEKLNSENTKVFSYSFYFASINSEIIVTFKNRRLVSIDDSSNTLTDQKKTEIINVVNSSAIGDCSCVWWDLVCKTYCAICEGLGNNDCWWDE